MKYRLATGRDLCIVLGGAIISVWKILSPPTCISVLHVCGSVCEAMCCRTFLGKEAIVLIHNRPQSLKVAVLAVAPRL